MKSTLVFDESGNYVGDDPELQGSSVNFIFPSLNWGTVLSSVNGSYDGVIFSRIYIKGDPFFVLSYDDESLVKGASFEGELEDLRAIIDAMPFGVAVIDRNKRVRKINRVALDLAGYTSAEEFFNRDVTCQESFCPAPLGHCPIWDDGKLFDCTERPFLLRDGTRITVMKSAVPIVLNGEELMIEGIIDLRPQKEAERQAMIDGLTSLYNRKGLSQLISEFEEDDSFSILAMDIDNFKYINDVYGHLTGDHILKKMSGFLKDLLPDGVKLVRWGGDEFLAVIPCECRELYSLEKSIGETIWSSDDLNCPPGISVSMSTGVACRHPGESWESVFDRADKRMYESKKGTLLT